MNATHEKRGSKKGRRKKPPTPAKAETPGQLATTNSRNGPKADAAKRPRGEKRARLNQALVLELRALRSALTKATEAFDLRVGGRLAEMLQTLEGDDSLDLPPRQLTVVEAQAALDEMADWPSGGRPDRLRELRRIQRLSRRLKKRITPG